MIQPVNKSNINEVEETVEIRRASKLNLHNVVLVITLSLVVTFLMVVGMSYLNNVNSLKGQSTKYFCPSSAAQVGVCLKS